MKFPIYLDYAATTPVDPRVAEKMIQYLTKDGVFGNPSSKHQIGEAAHSAVEQAREQVASLIEAECNEIIWTASATEANNLAIKGAAQLYQEKGKHIITLKTEHPAVLACCQQLEKTGFSVSYLSPEKNGVIDLEKLHQAMREDTILVSIMHVNNEIGTIQNIERIAEMTAERGILFHVDAAQSAGKIPLNVKKNPIDLLSLAAHKIYGPKGIGALYVRRKPRVRLAAQIHGGGQEQGMRSGTLATHQIIGMGEAFYIAKNEMRANQEKIQELRTQFLNGIQQDIVINGENSIPNILNVRIKNLPAQVLLQSLPEIAFSAGAACNGHGSEPSYILRALGQSVAEAECGVRFSFGRFTTADEIDFVIAKILAIKNLAS